MYVKEKKKLYGCGGPGLKPLVAMVGLAIFARGGYGRPVLVAMVGLAYSPCSSFRQQRAPAPNSNAKAQAPTST